eukprot:5252562-Prorocentrum_lima.AAC.1
MHKWPAVWDDFDKDGFPDWARGSLQSKWHPAVNTQQPYPVRPNIKPPKYQQGHNPANRPQP